VVGAGPVGLTAALALAQQGIPLTVVEAEPDLTTDLRASTLHCASLDQLHRLGVMERLLETGYRVRYWQIRDRNDGVVAEWDLGLLSEDTEFPFRIACEQHKLARILFEKLSQMSNVSIQFGARFIAATQDDTRVYAEIETSDGPVKLQTNWLIGADGGRSLVRKSAAIPFEGFTWPEQFLGVSTDYDFEPHGYTYSAYIADPVEWAALFKVPHEGPPGVWRLMFPVEAGLTAEQAMSDAFIEARMQAFLRRSSSYRIVYRNLYRVHQRVASTFRMGRVLLIGDAAHVNNPVGALGLNSGIHDATNLADKLGRVWRGEADDTLLDLFERQRRAISLESVQADSIRNKRLLEERDPATRAARLDEIRETAKDRRRARDYLLKSSMIDSVRRAALIH
jgi:3-(3-hydroxy-phenyl)propionate hydroxylase